MNPNVFELSRSDVQKLLVEKQNKMLPTMLAQAAPGIISFLVPHVFCNLFSDRNIMIFLADSGTAGGINTKDEWSRTLVDYAAAKG